MTLFDYLGMNAIPAAHHIESDPEALLQDVIASGWLNLIVPTRLGGEGASTAEIAKALQHLAKRHLATGWVAWSQGLVVEALVRSPNVAVRETVLPDLLDGSRAGAVSWAPEFGLALPPTPVQASPLDRGWHLQGRLEQVFNLQWSGYLVLCPVWFPSDPHSTPQLGWTLLRSEEDGLRANMDRKGPLRRQAACGDLHLERVYFREDELLADDAMTLRPPLSVLDQAMREALWAGTLLK